TTPTRWSTNSPRQGSIFDHGPPEPPASRPTRDHHHWEPTVNTTTTTNTAHEDRFDYVIVGGGSAGSVLAMRLSADPSVRVCVLEAGRSDWRIDPFINMPAALTYPIGSRFYDWRYESEPEEHMGGRRVF